MKYFEIKKTYSFSTKAVLFLVTYFMFSADGYAEKSNMYRRLHNPDIEYQKGMMYYSGKGIIDGARVVKDYTKALEQFLKADKYGSIEAKIGIAGMYYKGDGVKQDYQQAFEWFNKAALLNNVEAQFYVGSMYRDGNGVERSNKKAIEWLSKAANASDDFAQDSLGEMYLNGVREDSLRNNGLVITGVKRNKDSGNVEITIRYLRSKEANDIALAKEWFHKSASKGNLNAKYNLATMYYQGDVNPEEKDHAKAAELLLVPAYSDHTEAQVLLGIMRYNGEGIEENKAGALALFQKANAKGNASAKLILRMLLDRAVEKNEQPREQ